MDKQSIKNGTCHFKNKSFDEVFLDEDILRVSFFNIKQDQQENKKVSRHEENIDPVYNFFIHQLNIKISSAAINNAKGILANLGYFYASCKTKIA
jgi:hypothetical protein